MALQLFEKRSKCLTSKAVLGHIAFEPIKPDHLKTITLTFVNHNHYKLKPFISMQDRR